MFRRVTRAVIDAVERHRRVLLVGWTLVLALFFVLRARRNAFWHDEIYAILISRLSVRSVWRTSVDGIDLGPPLNSILTHFAHLAAGATTELVDHDQLGELVRVSIPR